MNFSRRNATQPLPPSPERMIDLGFVEEFHGLYIGVRGRCVICTWGRQTCEVLQ